MKIRCTRCDAFNTPLDDFNKCTDKVACEARRRGETPPPENELRIISDHLGSIRDLLALISRELPDQRERLFVAALGHLLARGADATESARLARLTADAAMGELATMSVHKLGKI